VFALASTVLVPVRRITERALEIAGADLRARLEPPAADDEMGAMTRALNTLLERLHAALDVNRRFAADAAHELRSPVTAMAGEIDVALRRERSTDEYRETLEVVRQRLTAFSSLIGDLMLLVRAQETRSQIVSQELSLEALVNSSIARVEPMAQAREVTLTVSDLSGLTVYGEAGLLARVFDNVMENAVRYNRHGGSVAVAAAFADHAHDTHDTWEPARVSVRVTDTGTGMPAVEHERVFTRFYRVDESRNRHTGGAGLGLAIAREILELFKGTIAIERSSAEGTTMLIRLPGTGTQDAG
jgi:signal transduction histidine kinase